MKRNRKRIQDIAPTEGKKIRPTVTSEKDWDQYNPVFSLHQLNPNYCIMKCTKTEKALFSQWLFKLSKLTWNQINKAGRNGTGYEKIPLTAIKAPIPAHVKGKKILVFHDYAPICGYREDRIFHIVWIDREYKLYKHS